MKFNNFNIISPLQSTCFHHSPIMLCLNGNIPWNFYVFQLHLSPCPSSEPIKTCISFFWPMAASCHNQAYEQPCPKKLELLWSKKWWRMVGVANVKSFGDKNENGWYLTQSAYQSCCNFDKLKAVLIIG